MPLLRRIDVFICAHKIDIRYLSVNSQPPSRVSRGARILMLVVLGALILLSLYANVQRLRRDKVETVAFTLSKSPLPSPSPSPR
jgi:hypothetical protein